MKYIYIYNEYSRASEYGIGTYIDQLVTIFKDLDNCQLSIIQSRSDCKNLRVDNRNGYVIYNIPSPTIFEKKFDNKYYRNIGYIILSILPKDS